MFSKSLKHIRKGRHMSQMQLAEALGVAQSTVGSWESGVREPDFNTVRRIADYFNVTTDYLLMEHGNDTEQIKAINQNDEIIYLDQETLEYIDALRFNPEMKMLFSVTSGATKEDIVRAVRIIEALKQEGGANSND